MTKMAYEGNQEDVHITLQQSDYTSVVDFVFNMFSQVMDRDAIMCVVESCDGNVQASIDAIMSMISSDTQSINFDSNVHTEPNTGVQTEPQHSVNDQKDFVQPSMLYSSASKGTGAIPKAKTLSKPSKESTPQPTQQISTILQNHDQGYRTMIIMRGLPGSGKTHLAQQIVTATVGGGKKNFSLHIFSTDDYFYYGGYYDYNKSRLSDAHEWNQNKVNQATKRGVSPVIIDNTNVKIWEMIPYVTAAVNEGYYIEVIEPNTNWARNPRELARRNSHNVPRESIERMLDRYEHGATPEYLIKVSHVNYPQEKSPPVLRNYPFLRATEPFVTSDQTDGSTYKPQLQSIRENTNQNSDRNQSASAVNKEVRNNQDVDIKKLEQEWESGETWEEEPLITVKKSQVSTALITEPKPPRKPRTDSDSSQERILPPVSDPHDWSTFMKLLPQLQPNASPPEQKILPVESIDTKSTASSFDAGDNDLKNCKYRIIVSTPRDINMFYMPYTENIPNKRKLDKSTMTNEENYILPENCRCKNEKKHFIALRKMFKNISKADLRDIFDKCYGDVNWAVNIVVDGVVNNEIKTNEEENLSDSDDECHEQCECMSNYSIVPDTNTKPESLESQHEPTKPPTTPLEPKKSKKDKTVSENSLQVKRQIEKNVVISEDHYSQRHLKFNSKMRRGPFSRKTEKDNHDGSKVQNEEARAAPDYSRFEDVSDDESVIYEEETVTFNVGAEFVAQLDGAFSRTPTNFEKDNLAPVVSMPVSMLNRLNALWLESLTYQLQSQAEYANIMMKEDAELARKLAEVEYEMEQSGQEPVVPDFKEIMDMELALSIHQKDVTSIMKKQEPNDLAAKMTRDKLRNLFPEIDPEILSELLMAHDNNFQATVEILLTSTGQSHVLEHENGISKFVMKKEMERQEKIMEDKNKELSEAIFPALVQEENIDMATVEQYRAEAQTHLEFRKENLQRAQEFMNLGKTELASHYAEVANFHRKNFEHANSKAAASLIHVNSRKKSNTTLDLHFFYVKEAIAALDLFLDIHIQSLQESNQNRPNSHVSKALFVITGRGLHSRGGPRLRPAVRRRLIERGYAVSFLNPGLLTVDIRCDNQLSHEFP